MIVGVPREIKKDEYRVALVPAGATLLVEAGHTVLVQAGAGKESGISDKQYQQAGAKILKEPKSLYRQSELVLKVKEPQPQEYRLLQPHQILFTFFHFAANKKLALEMIKREVACVAYETVEDEQGKLPVLIPMSEVAGRMSVQEGAKYLERPMRGKGILLGGIPGVAPANVLILGGGVVGTHAAKVAAGLGARVTILDVNLDRLRYLEDIMPKNAWFLSSNPQTLAERLPRADLVICAALIRGARSPVLVSRKVLKTMRPGSVIVDVAIDQGGCVETSRPTTHHSPTFVSEGVVHYCVTNIPGAVPITSTFGLANVTLPLVQAIASEGLSEACRSNPALAKGVNILQGQVTYEATADALGLPYVPLSDLL